MAEFQSARGKVPAILAACLAFSVDSLKLSRQFVVRYINFAVLKGS